MVVMTAAAREGWLVDMKVALMDLKKVEKMVVCSAVPLAVYLAAVSAAEKGRLKAALMDAVSAAMTAGLKVG